MKKALLLCFALMLCSLGVSANDAMRFTIGHIEYITTGDATVGVYDYNDRFEPDETVITHLEIPSTVTFAGVTYTVTSVEEQGIYWASNLVKITMPNTITRLGYRAIYYNDNLEEIVLSENLTSLDQFAFSTNVKLKSLSIPAGVTEIPNNCFYRTEGMQSITFAGKITSIGNGAFYKSGITSIDIPGSCTVVNNNAFQLCPNLATVTLGEGVTALNEGAFRSCGKLETINLPSTLKKIGTFAFVDNVSLKSVTIPAGVTEIGDAAFANTGIAAFQVEQGNTVCKSVDGVLYQADGKVLMAYPNGASATEYTIEEGCLGVGKFAFSNSPLTKIVVPEGMRAFDDNAFSESALEDINFPSSLALIGNQTFAATKLTSLVVPEMVNTIYEGAFAECKQLTTVTLHSDVRTLESYAFLSCTALTSINCLGAIPTEMSYYEGYDHPFAGVSAEVEIFVPKGFKSDYQNSEWGYYFTTIRETETGVFLQTSTSPSENSQVAQLTGIEITFPSNATVVNQTPNVVLSKGQELYGQLIQNEGGWMAYANGSKVNVFPADIYGEGVQPINLENGVMHYVTIPAGVVKNSSGSLNQKIVIALHGKGSAGIESIESDDTFVAVSGDDIVVALGSLNDCTVQLFDLTGKMINQMQNVNGSCAMTVAQKGVFVVKVTSGSTTKTFKVAK